LSAAGTPSSGAHIVPMLHARQYRAVQLIEPDHFENIDPEIDVDEGAIGCGLRVLGALLKATPRTAQADRLLMELWVKCATLEPGPSMPAMSIRSEVDPRTREHHTVLGCAFWPEHDSRAWIIASEGHAASDPSPDDGRLSRTLTATDLHRRAFCAVAIMFSDIDFLVIKGSRCTSNNDTSSTAYPVTGAGWTVPSAATRK
jgi:hypothetical protein